MRSPDYKYYGLNIRTAAMYKDNRAMQLNLDIHADLPRKKAIKINGIIRPTFQLEKIHHSEPVDWISIDSSLIKNSSKVLSPSLDFSIQSHAMKRMAQRLNLFDKWAVNYALWENTPTITACIDHRAALLLPIIGIKRNT